MQTTLSNRLLFFVLNTINCIYANLTITLPFYHLCLANNQPIKNHGHKQPNPIDFLLKEHKLTKPSANKINKTKA